MNSLGEAADQRETSTARSRAREAFTLVEILIVISIIILLITLMGAVIGNTVKKAREAATATLIEKIDKLLDERTKGFDRATKSLDFQRVIAPRKQSWEASGVSVSPRMLLALSRKDFFKSNFPQRFEDLASPDANANGVPDILEAVPGVNVSALASQATPTTRHATESSELLYFMLTRMQVFGVPPVGESDFSTSEVRDTDGDGLLEFVDGWGRPLRFYRWPTRLLKPNGIRGFDNQYGVAGVDDDGNTITDDLLEFGKINTDDINIPWSPIPTTIPFPPTDRPNIRAIAGYLIEGLPSPPVISGQWDTLSEDPDDPYGSISTEIKRQYLSSNGATNLMRAPYSVNETNFPTIDTHHTPLIISVGPDGDLGLFEPYQGTASGASGAGVLDTDLGILAQPIHGPAGPYDIGNLVISALTDNITNRNRRAGKGK